MKGDKCKFCETCEWYDKKSVTCNKDGGDYYGFGRPSGCYISNLEKEKKK